MKRITGLFINILIGAVAILLIEAFSQQIAETLHRLFHGWLLIGLSLSLLIFLVLLRLQWEIEVDLDVYNLEDSFAAGNGERKGLIVFLSLYRQIKPSPKEELSPEKIRKAVKKMDYGALRLDETTKTSLGHQIEAIKAHKKNLRHCWLICTKSKNSSQPQSIDYASVFEKYIKEQIGPGIEVHYGKDYTILIDNETDICKRTYRCVKKIYREARALGVKRDELITDVTGGSKSMTSGALFASINREDDVQLIGSHYDDNGNPIDAFPMVISYSTRKLEM